MEEDTSGNAQPHQRQGQVRQAHLRRLHLPDDEGDAGGEEGGNPIRRGTGTSARWARSGTA